MTAPEFWEKKRNQRKENVDKWGLEVWGKNGSKGMPLTPNNFN